MPRIWERGWRRRQSSNSLKTNALWRRWWDSNPRYGYPYNGFRDRSSSSSLLFLGLEHCREELVQLQIKVVASPGFGPIFITRSRSSEGHDLPSKYVPCSIKPPMEKIAFHMGLGLQRDQTRPASVSLIISKRDAGCSRCASRWIEPT